MTIGTNFIRGANPVWSFVDLNGLQFDDTFWMWTLQNTIPYNPQPVYHDINGLNPWTDPVPFNANGTLPVDVFFDDTLVYTLQFRQHVGLGPPTQADPLIYQIPDYIPNGTGVIPSDEQGVVTDNQILNPQFAVTNFNNGLTIQGNGGLLSVLIAPNWVLTLNGSGSVMLTALALNASNPNPTNAPYALQLTINGPWVASPVLTQQFQENGQNWQGKYLAGSLTALTTGGPVTLLVNVTASNGQPLGTLMNPTLTNSFVEYTGNTLVPMYTNFDTPPNAYLNYNIMLPNAGTVYLTSAQLIVSNVASNYSYEQTTVESQFNGLSQYYVPQLTFKPIPSWLVGWDFALNPAQINGPTIAAQNYGANSSYYIWDQTILYQSVTSFANVSRSATDNSLQIVANQASGQIALIQYLEPIPTLKLLQGPMSVHIQGYSNVFGGLPGAVTLWATNSPPLPNVATGTNLSIVNTLDGTGFPTILNGPNWKQVPRSNLGNATFSLGAQSSTFDFSNDVELTGWDFNGDAYATTAVYLAIVVGFAPMGTTGANQVNINSISLCQGTIATRPSPQTADDVLRECERFYEKSYNSSDVAGAMTSNNIRTASGGVALDPTANLSYGIPMPFSIVYNSIKRAVPNVTIYNPATGVPNSLMMSITQLSTNIKNLTSFSTYWSNTNSNVKCAVYTYTGLQPIPIQLMNRLVGSSEIYYHFVADARLGIVN